jgi:hypothetical protein
MPQMDKAHYAPAIEYCQCSSALNHVTRKTSLRLKCEDRQAKKRGFLFGSRRLWRRAGLVRPAASTLSELHF